MNFVSSVKNAIQKPIMSVMVGFLTFSMTISTGCVMTVRLESGKNMLNRSLTVNKMKKKQSIKINNWFNYEQKKGEYNSGELKTVPDLSFTIPEILEKFTRGLNVDDLFRDGQYSDTEADFDDIHPNQLAKDPYDIDSTLLASTKYGREKAEAVASGLPEEAGGSKRPLSDDGVKDEKASAENP